MPEYAVAKKPRRIMKPTIADKAQGIVEGLMIIYWHDIIVHVVVFARSITFTVSHWPSPCIIRSRVSHGKSIEIVKLL